MFKTRYLIFALALILLLPATVFASSPPATQAPPAHADSLQIFIAGVPVPGPFREGTVIPQERRAPGLCDNPSYRIKTGPEVQRIKIGPREDSCDIEIKALELNPTQFPEDAGTASSVATSAGYTWRLDTLAKIVGINSIDDLTRTRSVLDVKTGSFTNTNDLFDGTIILRQCWAHNELNVWRYEVDRCVKTGNTTSSVKMYAKTHGYYTHETRATFAHDVVANAIVRGDKSLPKAFDYECYQNSKPGGSDLECYFNWTYQGYQ